MGIKTWWSMGAKGEFRQVARQPGLCNLSRGTGIDFHIRATPSADVRAGEVAGCCGFDGKKRMQQGRSPFAFHSARSLAPSSGFIISLIL
jgi:hypothetical protein